MSLHYIERVSVRQIVLSTRVDDLKEDTPNRRDPEADDTHFTHTLVTEVDPSNLLIVVRTDVSRVVDHGPKPFTQHTNTHIITRPTSRPGPTTREVLTTTYNYGDNTRCTLSDTGNPKTYTVKTRGRTGGN